MSDGFRGLRLYNTLTRAKEDFVPLDPENVRLYVCGPTVYDYAHIGNARPAIVFDVLYRLLRHLYGEKHVTYVRNITDVDDKINARALRDYGAEIAAGRLGLNEAIRRVTEPTYEQYQKDVTALGCLPPTHQPRATEFVLPREDGRADMVGLIQSLVDRGHAYAAAGEILFDIGSMPAYGRLSRRNLDEQQAGARVAVDAHKKNPADFVLWKESSAEEPGWDGRFRIAGREIAIHGRPGWHIECSAMSAAYLGEVFDIHGGGLDLIFPHHENEIAQSCCAHGTDVMANVWMHNGFLQVEGKKMSKSDGNFVTIHELLRPWAGPVMRLAMLQTHYRQPIDWTGEKLRLAREEIAAWATQVFDGGLLGEFESNLLSGNRGEIDQRVMLPLMDDLNTVDAIAGLRSLYAESRTTNSSKYRLLNAAHLLGLVPLRKIGALLSNTMSGTAPIQFHADFRELYTVVQAASANSEPQIIASANDKISAHKIVFSVSESDGFVSLDQIEGGTEQPDRVQGQIDRRLAFIAEKNWAEADRIRDELLAQGIQLKDGKDKDGNRVTTWEVQR